MKLALYYTLACTAQCAHCVTEAGPRVSRKMSLTEAHAIIEGVSRSGVLDGICFTGGENFIYGGELLELIGHCTRLGLESEIISNAFWAGSVDAAVRFLQPFVNAGLGCVRISIDEYHLPYVPTVRVRNALEASKSVGLGRNICCVLQQKNADSCRTPEFLDRLRQSNIDLQTWQPEAVEQLLASERETWNPDLVQLLRKYDLPLQDCALIEDWYQLHTSEHTNGMDRLEQFLAEKILVFYQYVATEGRGRDLLDNVKTWHIDDMKELVCESVGRNPTIIPEGEMYPCCSSWVNMRHMHAGVFPKTDVAELMDNVAADPIALFMHRQGPKAMLDFLRSKGYQLPDRYSHICHMCGVLLERFSREELESLIADFYSENPWRLVLATSGIFLNPTAPRDLASEVSRP